VKYFLVTYDLQSKNHLTYERCMEKFGAESRKQLLKHMYEIGAVIVFMIEIDEDEFGEVWGYIEGT
jgi:hypothetical protein